MCACVCAVVLLVLWVRCCMPLYKLIALRVHPRMMFCLLYIIIIFVSYYRLYHLCSVWWKVDGVKALLYHGPLSYIQCVHINYTGFCWFNVITSAGSTSATRGQCGLNAAQVPEIVSFMKLFILCPPKQTADEERRTNCRELVIW